MLPNRRIRISESDFCDMITNIVEEITYKMLNEDGIIPTTAGNGTTSGDTGTEMSGHSGVADGQQNKESFWGGIGRGVKNAFMDTTKDFLGTYAQGTVMDPNNYNDFNKGWGKGHRKANLDDVESKTGVKFTKQQREAYYGE